MTDQFNITIDLSDQLEELRTSIPVIIKDSINAALKEYRELQTQQPLTATEIAEKLDVSRVTISNWVKAGYIPSKVIGGRRYFILSEVLEHAPTPKGKASKG